MLLTGLVKDRFSLGLRTKCREWNRKEDELSSDFSLIKKLILKLIFFYYVLVNMIISLSKKGGRVGVEENDSLWFVKRIDAHGLKF